jgi:hypothetical protein
MDNDKNLDNQNGQSGDLIPEVESAAPKSTDSIVVKPRRPRSPKPVVEGINSPVLGEAKSEAPSAENSGFMGAEPQPGQSTIVPPKISLTNSEQQLVDEPLLPAAPKEEVLSAPVSRKIILPPRKFSVRKLVWSLLISLLAVCLVFGVLLWLNNRGGGQWTQSLGLFPQHQTPPAAPVDTTPVDTAPVNTAPASATVPIATATQPSIATSTPAPAAVVKQVKISTTPTGYLNVRATPATSGKLVTQVHPGEIYPYTAVQNNWYNITLIDGRTGWVTGQYVSVVQN